MTGTFSLDGRLAVVTGVRRGIGGAGAVRDRVEAHGRRFRGFAVDLGDRAAVRDLVERLGALDQPVDILVNNAGTIHRKPAVDHPDDAWDRVLEVNLTAPFLLARELGAGMVRRRHGKVIFTASLLSFQGGVTVPGYAASKRRRRARQGAGQRVGAARGQRQRRRPRLHRHRQHPGPAR
jgi:2-deoxy-D-gluconate 3-dehydrogenase